MNRLFKTSMLVAALFPAALFAAPETGDQEITLNGAGTSDKDFEKLPT